MNLTIEQLEERKRYRQLHAPFARVVVEGKDLLRNGLELVSVSVDQTLEGMDQFTFIVNNAFDIKNREFITLRDPNRNFLPDSKESSRPDNFFDFGRRVEIFIGYRDRTQLNDKKSEPMFTGIITSFRTSFPSGGLPQITVSGYDLSYCMSKGKRSPRPWDDKKDSDVVKDIADDYDLKTNVDDSRVEHRRIEQSQQTDYDFLKKLAERNGFELYVRNKILFFKKPLKPIPENKATVIELEWSKGLLSFTPEISLSEQITKVEVTGWNVSTKKEITGSAGIGDEPKIEGGESGGQTRKAGGAYLSRICPKEKQPAHRVRRPVYSQEEANRVARALLKTMSEGFVRGSAESIGVPEIRPYSNISLKGLGKKFSKIYFVEKATHSVSSSGYKTNFSVKESTI